MASVTPEQAYEQWRCAIIGIPVPEKQLDQEPTNVMIEFVQVGEMPPTSETIVTTNAETDEITIVDLKPKLPLLTLKKKAPAKKRTKAKKSTVKKGVKKNASEKL